MVHVIHMVRDPATGLATFSDRLSVFDLRGLLPHVLHVPLGAVILPDMAAEARGVGAVFQEYDVDGGNAIAVSEFLAVDEFVVPMNELGVQAACAALRALPDIAARHRAACLAPVRCYGLAVSRLLELFTDDAGLEGGSAERGAAADSPARGPGARRLRPAGIRFLSFLGGAPSHGPGAIPDRPPTANGSVGATTEDGGERSYAETSRDLYRQIGEAASAAGVSMEIIGVSLKHSISVSKGAMSEAGGCRRL